MAPQDLLPLQSHVPLIYALATTIGIMMIVMLSVMAVSMIATSLITAIIYVIRDYICLPCFGQCGGLDLEDIELGIIGGGGNNDGGGSDGGYWFRVFQYQSMDFSFNNIIEVVEESEDEDEDEDDDKEGSLRLEALEKLLPGVVYGGEEMVVVGGDDGECGEGGDDGCEECCICLEDYKEGDFCRVFPRCNHLFHLKCIDIWLMEHLTCPICRNCLLDL